MKRGLVATIHSWSRWVLHEVSHAWYPDSPATQGLVAGLWYSLSGAGTFISRAGSGILVDMFGFVAVRNRDRDMRQKLPMRTSAAPRMSKSAVLLKEELRKLKVEEVWNTVDEHTGVLCKSRTYLYTTRGEDKLCSTTHTKSDALLCSVWGRMHHRSRGRGIVYHHTW